MLERWLTEARAANVPEPGSVAFVTVGEDGRPSARTVLLKQLEDQALIFTSALWTRKAREIEANPHVALLFYWPTIGRQVHVAGRATLAERELGIELFAQREVSHRVQT
jgi:pyridoxamine 5'-phosphate oxidase